MKIVDLLNPAAIVADLKASDKVTALEELADAVVDVESDLDRTEILRVLQERERLGSTGIGEGVAIPHGKLKEIDRLLISFGRSTSGVEFDSMDGKPAKLFFPASGPRRVGGRPPEDPGPNIQTAQESRGSPPIARRNG
jgi:PTS system nitrogen regulatory IIA component